MLQTFAVLSLVCPQLPAQQSAAMALNEPARAQIETLTGSGSVARWLATTELKPPGPYANATILELVETLKDSDVYVRLTAAEELGFRGPAAKAASRTSTTNLRIGSHSSKSGGPEETGGSGIGSARTRSRTRRARSLPRRSAWSRRGWSKSSFRRHEWSTRRRGSRRDPATSRRPGSRCPVWPCTR